VALHGRIDVNVKVVLNNAKRNDSNKPILNRRKIIKCVLEKWTLRFEPYFDLHMTIWKAEFYCDFGEHNVKYACYWEFLIG
jgi:hypothetical protein